MFPSFIDSQPNDGPKLTFTIDKAQFRNRFVYKKGGLYNVVFTAVKSNPISVMNIYYAEPPYSINVLWALPQFILMAIGELMFGLMGCQFFVEQTPQKLKYQTMLDWYWALAWSNIIILIAIHSGWFITFFFQIYWLSITVLVGFMFFFYFTFRYPFVYLRPGEAPPPRVMAPPPTPDLPPPTEKDLNEMLPMTVTVASDVPAPTEPESTEPVDEEPTVLAPDS